MRNQFYQKSVYSCCVLFLSFLLTGQAHAALSGIITDLNTSYPIPNVSVISDSGESTHTNARGEYVLSELDAGLFEITFTKTGYQSLVKQIYVDGATQLNIQMAPPCLLNILTTTLLPASVNVPYNQAIEVSCEAAPFQFQIACGNLPPNMQIDPRYGNIYGTPPTAGSFSFCVGVYDVWQNYAEKEYVLAVTQELAFKTSENLPSGTQWQPIMFSIEAVNGSLPYTFKVLSGWFPAGVYMSNTGQVGGSCVFTDTFDSELAHYWQTGGEAMPFVTESQRLQFGNMNQGQTSWIQMTWYTHYQSILSFAYEIKHDGSDTDSLILFVDQLELARLTRNQSSQMTIEGLSEGMHTFKWMFEKQSSASVFSTAFLDTIECDGITAVPFETGSTYMTIRVTDGDGRFKDKTFHMKVVEPLTLEPMILDQGIVRKAYEQHLYASGGAMPYTFAIYYGRPPVGLTLNPKTGVFSGTPDETAHGTLVFSVTDADGRVDYLDCLLQVGDPLTFEGTSLPDGLVNERYSESVRVSGGTYPLTMTVSGQLPNGLTFNPALGVVQGKPESTGVNNIEVTVMDATFPVPQIVTQRLSIRIRSGLTIFSSAILPKAQKNQEITDIIFQAGGGKMPYFWELADGALPRGIGFDSGTGIMSGTPLDKGDILFDLRVTDSLGATATKSFVWYISDSLKIATHAVPDGVHNEPYSYCITGNGGYPPYFFRIKSGALLTGLTFHTHTGTIDGTPKVSGEIRTFTIEISDSDTPAQIATKTFTMQAISDELYIITSELPLSRVNQYYSHIIEAGHGMPPYSWRLKSGLLPQNMELIDGPATARLQGKPEQTGLYHFEIEVSDKSTPPHIATRKLILNVQGTIEILTQSLKKACNGQLYSDQIMAANGTLPYRFSIPVGNLPGDIQLNPRSGDLTGLSHLFPGDYAQFTIRVTDSGKPEVWDEKDLFIYGMYCSLTILPKSLPQGVVMMPYELVFKGEGGMPPYRFYLDQGNLPEKLILDPQTSTLTGTPERPGIYRFMIKMEDSSGGAAQQSYQMEVIDCTACPIISGVVQYDNQSIMTDVNLTFREMDGTTRTIRPDDTGYYAQKMPSGWSGTVIPSREGYTFSPENRVYQAILSDQLNQDYVGSVIMLILSGKIIQSDTGRGISGVDVRYGDAGAHIQTLTDGSFTIKVPYGWSGTLTPEKAGYRFEPVSLSYETVTEHHDQQQFNGISTAQPDIQVSPLSLVFTRPTAKSEPEIITPQGNDKQVQPDYYGTGLKIPAYVKQYWETHEPPDTYRRRSNIPASLDWSKFDSPVRDQKSCGSCWAFAAVAHLENLSNQAGLRQNIDLSEQVMVSCVYETRQDGGCEGGWYWDVFNYVQKSGIPPEVCYPYIARNGTCSNQCDNPDFELKLTDYTPGRGLWGETFTVDDLKGALQEGPLSVGFYVPSSFYNYSGGIYDYKSGSMSFGHAVLLVGYDDATQSFKVKNSWGTRWGEDGYFRIAYNDTQDIKFGCYACLASGVFINNQGQVVTIKNSGTGDLKIYRLLSDKTWLGFQPESLSPLSPGQSQTVSLFIKSWQDVGLPEDQAIFTIQSNDPDESSIGVTIQAKSQAQMDRPILMVSPPFQPGVWMESDVIHMTANPYGDRFQLWVSNGGGSDLSWTTEVFNSWVSIQSGQTGSNQGEIDIFIGSNAGSSMATRTGILKIISTEAINSPQWVQIHQEKGGMYGDINHNNTFDLMDVVVILQILSNNEPNEQMGYTVSLKHAIMIMRELQAK